MCLIASISDTLLLLATWALMVLYVSILVCIFKSPLSDLTRWLSHLHKRLSSPPPYQKIITKRCHLNLLTTSHRVCQCCELHHWSLKRHEILNSLVIWDKGGASSLLTCPKHVVIHSPVAWQAPGLWQRLYVLETSTSGSNGPSETREITTVTVHLSHWSLIHMLKNISRCRYLPCTRVKSGKYLIRETGGTSNITSNLQA